VIKSSLTTLPLSKGFILTKIYLISYEAMVSYLAFLMGLDVESIA
jgi:hypothetical protein